MINRTSIVAEAMTWLNTPFHHCARVKGVGVDCVGLAVGVASSLGMEVHDVKGYPHVPINGVFINAIREQTIEITVDEVEPADMLIFRFDAHEPQHIAIITRVDPIRIIHAYSQVKKCVEHELDQIWKARLVGACRFKELHCQHN